jgi:hypothetical protein
MKPWQNPPLNKAPSNTKPSQATGEKKEQRERTLEDMTGLVLKDVLLAGGIYPSSLLRWRYALHALFISSSSHSHHRHYACTLPLSKSVPVLLDSFDFEKNLQFWFLFGGFTEDRTSFAV